MISPMELDIIGDLHGHAGELTALLARLGYHERAGAWRPPTGPATGPAMRQAIFVGDFIDRGPSQLETVAIVRRMIDAGTAQAVMGNHELNAIAWVTPDPDQPGEFLRPRLGRKGAQNRAQHEAFLAAVGGDAALHAEIIAWFRTLPLWLDTGELRVIHACWHPAFMTQLGPHLAPGNRITDALLPAATKRPVAATGPTAFHAVETLIKGTEIPLPDGHAFHDKDGHERREVRTRWWDAAARTFRAAALLGARTRLALPDLPIPAYAHLTYDGARPLFIGHYWMSGTPAPLTDHIACVDYSAGKGGPLVAYRWRGEPVLRAAGFCTSRD